MLKITSNTDQGDTIIKLEGRLAGPWVKELQKSWQSIQAVNKPRKAWVDLQGVTYVDQCGKDVLKRIHQQGGVLSASGCMINAIVKEITGGVG